MKNYPKYIIVLLFFYFFCGKTINAQQIDKQASLVQAQTQLSFLLEGLEDSTAPAQVKAFIQKKLSNRFLDPSQFFVQTRERLMGNRLDKKVYAIDEFSTLLQTRPYQSMELQAIDLCEIEKLEKMPKGRYRLIISILSWERDAAKAWHPHSEAISMQLIVGPEATHNILAGKKAFYFGDIHFAISSKPKPIAAAPAESSLRRLTNWKPTSSDQPTYRSSFEPRFTDKVSPADLSNRLDLPPPNPESQARLMVPIVLESEGPFFQWPAPQSSSRTALDRGWFTTLDLNKSIEKIENALAQQTYTSLNRYEVPEHGGVALVTLPEKIRGDGSRTAPTSRIKFKAAREFSLARIINAIDFDGLPGRYRIMAFILTPRGAETDCLFLVYEFDYASQNSGIELILPSQTSAITHLKKTGLLRQLRGW